MPDKHLTPEQNAKVKKNLLRFFMFTVIMIFAGLSSAYIVSMGEFFWVDVKLPGAFQYSTACIILSSLFLVLAVRGIKKGNYGTPKVFLGIAMILGIAFGYFQFFEGRAQLFEEGAPLTGPIMNQRGVYGEPFSLTYEGKEITQQNSKFYWRGEDVEGEMLKQMKTLATELEEGAKDMEGTYNLSNYGEKFMLLFDGSPVTYVDNKFQVDGVEFNKNLHYKLMYFGENIRLGRGDFYMIGEYGKDFEISYKGDPLTYENGTFYRKGKRLTPAQLDRLNVQDNNASSYIYVFAGVHLLHWVGGVIALIVLFIRGLRLRYTKDNYLGLTLGANYWHFLGILWLYLYLFLIFIH